MVCAEGAGARAEAERARLAGAGERAERANGVRPIRMGGRIRAGLESGRKTSLEDGVVALQFIVGDLGAVGVPFNLFILDEFREDMVAEGAADEFT